MFNIKEVLGKILGAIETTYGPKWQEVKSEFKSLGLEYLAESEKRLAELAQERIAGNISNEFMVSRLKEELTIVQSELISFEIISASLVQEAINKAIDIFQGSINTLLPPVE